MLSPRPAYAAWSAGNTSIGGVSDVGTTTITPGADMSVAITGRWGTSNAGQSLTFHGSRLTRHIANLPGRST
jgi:hypothetical protein